MKKHRKVLFPNNNSYNGTSRSLRFLKCLISYLSFLFLWTSIILSVAIFVFEVDWDIYFVPLMFSICLYLLIFIVSSLVSFKLERNKYSIDNIFKVFFTDLINGIILPFIYLKGFMVFLLFSIAQIIPFVNKKISKPNIKNIKIAILYILSFLMEFITFNLITGIKLDDYLYLISKGIDRITDFF